MESNINMHVFANIITIILDLLGIYMEEYAIMLGKSKDWINKLRQKRISFTEQDVYMTFSLFELLYPEFKNCEKETINMVMQLVLDKNVGLNWYKDSLYSKFLGIIFDSRKMRLNTILYGDDGWSLSRDDIMIKFGINIDINIKPDWRKVFYNKWETEYRQTNS